MVYNPFLSLSPHKLEQEETSSAISVKLKLRKKFLYLKISVSELCIQEIYNPKAYKYVIIYRSIDRKTPLKSFPIWCITYSIICCLTQEKSFNAPLKSEAAIFAIYASEDRWEPHKENALCWRMTQQKHFWASLLRIFWIFESVAIAVAPPADGRLRLAEARRSTFSGHPRERSGPLAPFSHTEGFSPESGTLCFQMKILSPGEHSNNKLRDPEEGRFYFFWVVLFEFS